MVSGFICVGVMGWQVLFRNKLDLSKQHEDSNLSAGASAELSGIRHAMISNLSLQQIILIPGKKLLLDVFGQVDLWFSMQTIKPINPMYFVHSE